MEVSRRRQARMARSLVRSWSGFTTSCRRSKVMRERRVMLSAWETWEQSCLPQDPRTSVDGLRPEVRIGQWETLLWVRWSCGLMSLEAKRRRWRERGVYAGLESRWKGLQGRALRAWRSLALFRAMDFQAFKVAGMMKPAVGAMSR